MPGSSQDKVKNQAQATDNSAKVASDSDTTRYSLLLGYWHHHSPCIIPSEFNGRISLDKLQLYADALDI